MADKTIINFGEKVHPVIWSRLAKIVSAERIGNGYIFSGPAGTGKEGVALSFAALLNCQNPGESACGTCRSCIRFLTLQHEHINIVFPLPTGKPSTGKTSDPIQNLDDDTVSIVTNSIQQKAADPFYKIRIPKANRILIQSIRHLRQKMYLKSLEKGQKIVVIFEAHLLSAGQGEAGNALLKLLEEPPENTTLILVTDNKAGLLQTILSRCQHIDFPPLETKIVLEFLNQSVSPSVAETAAVLSEGNMIRAERLSKYSSSELLTLLKDIVSNLSIPNPNDHRQFVRDMMTYLNNDPEEFDFRISLAQIWYSLIGKLRSNMLIASINKNFESELLQMIEKYPNANIVEINHVLEDLKQAPRRNLHMTLALSTAAIGIQHFLDGATRFTNQHETMTKLA